MSWRDELQPGSFRGVPFLIDAASTQVGRRGQLHEYPLRDRPWGEDLGLRTRRFYVECLVIGSDYMTARDKLIAALETAGAGTLVHPYYGTRSVVVFDPAEVQESTREGGMARFRIPFADSGEKIEPAATTDTQTLAANQAALAQTQLVQSFASSYSLAGTPAWVSESASGDLADLTSWLSGLRDRIPGIPSSVTDFDALLRGFSDTVSSLIRAPFNLGASVVSLIVGLGTMAQQPLDALGLYTGLCSYGTDALPLPTTTPARVQQAANRAALFQLVQGTAVAQAVAAAASVPVQAQSQVMLQPSDDADGTLVSTLVTVMGYDTVDTAIAAREQITDAIDAQTLIADDDVYPHLLDLRAAVVRDIGARVAGLPALTTYETASVLPALVIAFRLYADATRDDDIVARNDLAYPGFVSGGVALEVLNV